MCTVTMTFDVPETRKIVNKPWTEEFRGKMSLTTYISQSVMGVVLFYGVGFGLGCSLGLWQTELVAVGVYLLLMASRGCG